jgi:hypothetical protein
MGELDETRLFLLICPDIYADIIKAAVLKGMKGGTWLFYLPFSIEPDWSCE